MTIAYNTSIVTSGLVLSLDAANTKSYPGVGTVWADLSGNGRNGTLTNGPTYSSSNSGSIVFDGTNDYTEFGDVLDAGTNSFTVNVWARPTALTASNYNITVSKAFLFVGNFRWAVGFFNGFMASFMQGNSAPDVEPRGSSSIALNTWAMFTYVFNRSSSVSMYLNGNLETLTGSATISQWNGLDFNSTHPFRVGSYTSSDNIGTTLNFSGNISNVHMYNRILSASEISQNFNALRGRYGI